VALLLLLGALAGCRQAPLDPGFKAPHPDRPLPTLPARVDYTAPDGFVQVYNYETVDPLYPVPVSVYLIPADAVEDFSNLDLLSILTYVMDVDVTDWSDQQLVDLVKDLVARVGAEVVEPEPTTVSGLPAFTVPVFEPGSTPSLGYTYDATYVFSGPHLVQISCQYEDRRALIERACTALIDSVEIFAS
jgi:hypothetical protein